MSFTLKPPKFSLRGTLPSGIVRAPRSLPSSIVVVEVVVVIVVVVVVLVVVFP